MKASLIDGTPLQKQPVDIVLKIPENRYGTCSDKRCKIVFTKRFTIPPNGIVDFVVPSSKIPQDAKYLLVQVSSNYFVGT